MARVNSAWFEFAGVTSSSLGVKLLELPTRKRPSLRVVDTYPVLGRDGLLWAREDAYEDFDLTVKVQIPVTVSRETVNKWLTGSGWLRFSDEPDVAYKARALQVFDYVHVKGNSGMLTAEAVFTCSPSRYVWPQAVIPLVNGASIPNPGTRFSEPLIVIVGIGDIDFTIGGKTLEITGLESAITIDMEARLAYNGSTNLCPIVGGDWPLLIQPGPNTASWTGSVSGANITPRWRSI